MILLFNIIGLVVALIGAYFIYYFHKQSKLYTDSVVTDIAPTFAEDIILSQPVNETIPVSIGNTKSFEEIIKQHLHKSIESYAETASIDKTLASNLNKVSIKGSEYLLKDLKFLNPSDLNDILYKTHFSEEVFKNWASTTQKYRSSYILELYSELFSSLALYKIIINNKLENGIDINYNVKVKNFLFHIDIPESKLNEVVIYPNPNKDDEQQELTAEIS